MKAKLALLKAIPPTSQTTKPFQPKNKGLVAKMFDWDEEEVSDDEEETRVKVLIALADDELSMGKNHARNDDANDNPFVPASLDYDHEMISQSKDWVETLNPDSKISNFNIGRILVPESKAVNECLQLTKAPFDLESSKESG
nr:retrovirus-related Pol polyprotein from transposon TNT 1-94 [Tanacetum cinerariifolium]